MQLGAWSHVGIRVEKSDHSSKIVIDISCHAIDTSTPYKALSYTWGSGNERCEVPLSGRVFEVTLSLSIALRALRGVDDSLTLWIDQVCINQPDDEERSSQVSLMGHIYSRAEEVLVWLGPEADDSNEVMDLWQTVGEKAQELRMGDYYTRESMALLHPILWNKNPEDKTTRKFQGLIKSSLPLFGQRLGAVVAWFSRAWFSRVWIVQEFALGTRPVFVCGEKRVEPEFVYFSMHIYLALGSRILDHGERDEMKRLMGILYTLPPVPFWAARKGRQDFVAKKGDGHTLYDLLRLLYVEHGMDATDYRDRIFALSGVAVDWNGLKLRVDYTKESDIDQVLLRTARALINSGQLKVLSLAQFKNNGGRFMKDVESLPSWVSDWRSYLSPSFSPRVNEKLGEHPHFSASHNSEPMPFITGEDENILGIHGRTVDIIEEIGNYWTETVARSEASRLAHLVTIEAFCSRSASLNHPIYTTPERRAEAVWRVAIGDLFSTGAGRFRASGSVSDDYKLCIGNSRYWEIMGDSKDGRYRAHFSSERNGSHYSGSMDYMVEKRPFLTRKGYVGMGTENIGKGDIVVIFAGAEIPHVIRPHSNDGTYEYLGEAYCDGVMDGEFWTEDGSLEAYRIR
ncbi:heterokaryon incompatibility protein [Triangularia verruculosa]|uniref:Heterokaryon incompatibility protein n=1 Tax=Triangularia verruculosa TaxID=2587418 RepID=A0AAN7AY37_9PEZI|nr:heterokaryon incompatibility protein [Triangularia verruculosa]